MFRSDQFCRRRARPGAGGGVPGSPADLRGVSYRPRRAAAARGAAHHAAPAPRTREGGARTVRRTHEGACGQPSSGDPVEAQVHALGTQKAACHGRGRNPRRGRRTTNAEWNAGGPICRAHDAAVRHPHRLRRRRALPADPRQDAGRRRLRRRGRSVCRPRCVAEARRRLRARDRQGVERRGPDQERRAAAQARAEDAVDAERSGRDREPRGEPGQRRGGPRRARGAAAWR